MTSWPPDWPHCWPRVVMFMTESAMPQQEPGATVTVIVEFLERRVCATRRRLLDQLGDGQRAGRIDMDLDDLQLDAQLAHMKARLATHHAEMLRCTTGDVNPPTTHVI
jgi:hypothetical protein